LNEKLEDGCNFSSYSESTQKSVNFRLSISEN
jgi:hypothetical protein